MLQGHFRTTYVGHEAGRGRLDEWTPQTVHLDAMTSAYRSQQVQQPEVGSTTDSDAAGRVPLPVPKDPKLPLLFLADDSTVRRKDCS
jgi:hypothetical protein